MKNFNNPVVKKQAIDNLILAKTMLDERNIPFFLSNGTLLGCIRDKDLIPHDCDIDIGVFIDDYDPIIFDDFIRKGFILYGSYGSKENGLEYSFTRGGIKLDIFFYYHEDDKTTMSVWGEEQRKYKFPKFTDLIDWEFLGQTFKIPKDYEGYLTSQYGDWKTPDTNWHWYTSPKNI